MDDLLNIEDVFTFKSRRKNINKRSAERLRESAINQGFNIRTTSRRITRNNMAIWQAFLNEQGENRRNERNAQRQQNRLNNRRRTITRFIFDGVRQAPQYGLTQRSYKMTFTEGFGAEYFGQIADQLHEDFQSMLTKIIRKENLHGTDKIGFRFELTSAERGLICNTFPVYTGMHNVENMSASVILDRITKHLQSNSWVGDGSRIHIDIVKIPRGGKKPDKATDITHARNKRSVVQIFTEEKNNCFFQAIALGYAKATDKKEYKRLCGNGKETIQRNRNAVACELAEKLGMKEDFVGIEQIPMVEEALNITINVYGFIQRDFIYPSGHREPKPININLLYFDNHYDLLSSPNALEGKDSYCQLCRKRYNSTHIRHNCQLKCFRCADSNCIGKNMDPGVQGDNAPLKCKECNFTFIDDFCLQAHIDNKVCRERKQCSNCRVIHSSKHHKCGKILCGNCGKQEDPDHECFHQRPVIKKPCEKLIAFDFETDPTKSPHEFLIGIATYIYDKPEYGPDVEDTREIGGKEYYVFESIDSFCEWLFHPKHKGYRAFAHNSGRYDSHFIRKYILEQGMRIKKQIVRGSNFMNIELEIGIEIKDSYLIIPFPLRSFPKAFGLKEMKKGYFPYTFVNRENIRQVYPSLPDIKHYCFRSTYKDKGEYARATSWYETNKSSTFDVYTELVQYCISDVELLATGIRTFRELIIEITKEASIKQGIHPVGPRQRESPTSTASSSQSSTASSSPSSTSSSAQRGGSRGPLGVDPTLYSTVASIAFNTYEGIFMPEDTIAVLQSQAQVISSNGEREWLRYIEVKEGIALERQVKILGAHVDGFDRKNNVVYQYHGCAFHGCRKCYKPGTIMKFKSMQMSELLASTMLRTKNLEKAKYKVVECWEHEWIGTEIRNEFLRGRDLDDFKTLDMKDAFFGGNTQPMKLYVGEKEGRKIRYLDFTSLYPAVMKGNLRPVVQGGETFECLWPIGHPEKFNVHEILSDLSNIHGFIKAKVIPANLYNPILPERRNGKLIFGCEPIVGTFTTADLKCALRYGYKIEQIYSAEHFPMSFTHRNVAKNLFREYVDMFLKIKQENDGWPDGVETEEQKQAFIDEYALKEGIYLEREKIKKNPALKSIAKLFLNSLWGKYAQRPNLPKYETLTNNPARFFQLMLDDELEVSNIFVINDETLDITYSKKKQCVGKSFKTNIAIASFTTAFGRARLQEPLQIIDKDVIYCDTDSIIYIESENNKNIITSSLLGDLKDELKIGNYITEFASTGPKSYAYTESNGKQTCKIKGFPLNIDNQEKLNLEVMKNMVFNQDENVETTGKLFRIEKQAREIHTNDNASKIFKFTFDKRVILPFDEEAKILDTIPFGEDTPSYPVLL